MTCKCGQLMSSRRRRCNPYDHGYDTEDVWCHHRRFWNFWKHNERQSFLVQHDYAAFVRPQDMLIAMVAGAWGKD